MSKAVIGGGVTNAGLGGYVPQINRTGYTEIREKRLFYSQREAGLIIPKMVRGGYGELPQGTIMAESFASPYDLVPYVPDTFALTDAGRVMLVTGCSAANSFQIWKEDSGKVKAGDVIILWDSDGTFEQATVSTVAATNDRIYTVTLSGVTTGNFELAKNACFWIKAGSSGKFSTAKYMLNSDIYTGGYDNPNGALTDVFLSNGIVYKDACPNLDATAMTAMGAVADGMYVIFK